MVTLADETNIISSAMESLSSKVEAKMDIKVVELTSEFEVALQDVFSLFKTEAVRCLQRTQANYQEKLRATILETVKEFQVGAETEGTLLSKESVYLSVSKREESAEAKVDANAETEVITTEVPQSGDAVSMPRSLVQPDLEHHLHPDSLDTTSQANDLPSTSVSSSASSAPILKSLKSFIEEDVVKIRRSSSGDESSREAMRSWSPKCAVAHFQKRLSNIKEVYKIHASAPDVSESDHAVVEEDVRVEQQKEESGEKEEAKEGSDEVTIVSPDLSSHPIRESSSEEKSRPPRTPTSDQSSLKRKSIPPKQSPLAPPIDGLKRASRSASVPDVPIQNNDHNVDTGLRVSRSSQSDAKMFKRSTTLVKQLYSQSADSDSNLTPQSRIKSELIFKRMAEAMVGDTSGLESYQRAGERYCTEVPGALERMQLRKEKKQKEIAERTGSIELSVGSSFTNEMPFAVLGLNDNPSFRTADLSVNSARRLAMSLDIWSHALVMYEHSSVRRTWNLIFFAVLVLNSVMLPYTLTFARSNRDCNTFHSPGHFSPQAAVEAVIDAVYILDVLLNFFTTYRNREGLVEWNLENIALKYLKSWLLLDVVCALPWDRIVYVFVSMEETWPCALRLIRLLSLLKFQLRVGKMERYLKNPGKLRLFRLAFFIGEAIHVFACVTYMIVENGSTMQAQSLIGVEEFSEKSAFMKYTSLLYWVSATMLGERSEPQDVQSVLLSISVFWLGLLMYFTAFNSLIHVLMNMYLPRIQYSRTMDRRVAYMRQLQMPISLRLRIVDYFKDLYEATQGVDAQEFMQELPRHLRQEVAVFLNEKILDSLTVFGDCELPFLTAVMMRLKTEVCMEGDLLCCEGDLGDEMYFVIQGQLDVFKNGLGKVATLCEGDFFGEGLLLEENGRRNASVKATRACTFYTLNKANFAEIRHAYPEDAEVFLSTNQKRRVVPRPSNKASRKESRPSESIANLS